LRTPLKIIFLCSSLEPGKDGVGDYTRKLAGALIYSGNPAAIIALNDKHLKTGHLKELQEDDRNSIEVLRFSNSSSWQLRISMAKTYIEAFKPDWVSLQYVSYGFDLKGLPFYLPKTLKQLSGNFRWHLMFHEVWAGISDEVLFKHRIYGYFQKRIATGLIQSLQPQKITTTNVLYQLILKEKNISVSLLPLFGNISVHAQNEAYLSLVEKQYSISLKDKEYYKLGIFGTSYPEANLFSVIPKYISEKVAGRKIVLLIFGRNNRPEEINKLKMHLNSTVIFAELGELSETKVSSVMSILDAAILCTPVEYIGKSGAYAALRLHKVDVATLSSAPIERYEKEILKFNNYLSGRPAEKWSVGHVSNKFISLLNS
jgi:hypothetical protein